jgi:energy-coupling factor transporter ATP-binding protein EcfA2
MPSFEATPVVSQGTALTVESNGLPDGFYEGNILEELSKTGKSVLITAATGCGKSTFMKALCYLKHHRDSSTLFLYLDLQAEDFLGLKSDPKVCLYLSGDPEHIFDRVSRCFAKVAQELKARVNRQQVALREGRPAPQFSPVWIVFNEWSNFWTQSTFIPKKDMDALLTNVMLIVTMGRGVKMGCILTAQLHRKDNIGLSPGAVKNMSLVALGLHNEDSPDGDFSSLEAAMTDQHIVSTVQSRELRPLLKQGIRIAKAQGCGLVFTTQGCCKLGFVPTEITRLANKQAHNYRHGSGARPITKVTY